MPYPSYRRILLIPLSFPNRNVLLIRNEVEHSLFVDRPVPGVTSYLGGGAGNGDDVVADTMATVKSLVRVQVTSGGQ